MHALDDSEGFSTYSTDSIELYIFYLEKYTYTNHGPSWLIESNLWTEKNVSADEIISAWYDCKAQSTECYFDATQSCKQNWSFLPAAPSKSSCSFPPTGDCRSGPKECETRCNAKQPKEYGECSATCGAGTRKLRPANVEGDRYYANCPWSNEPCPALPGCDGSPPPPPPPGASTLKTTRKKTTTKKGEPDEETEPVRTREPDEVPMFKQRTAAPSSGTGKWMIIAAIIMAALLMILTVVVITVCCVKRRRRRRLEGHHGHGHKPPARNPPRYAPRYTPKTQPYSTTTSAPTYGSSVARSAHRPRHRR